MQDEETAKRDPEAEEALSRAAREAVRQPADPRLERSFARLGLFTDDDAPPAAPPRPGEPVPEPGPIRPTPAAAAPPPMVGSVAPAVDLEPLRVDVASLEATVRRLEGRLAMITNLLIAVLVGLAALALVVLIQP
jgi:hypothetical protein